jgi:hypothetical protein
MGLGRRRKGRFPRKVSTRDSWTSFRYSMPVARTPVNRATRNNCIEGKIAETIQ